MTFRARRRPTLGTANITKEPAMPRRETAPIGAPCWVDLLTSDPDKSRSFYGELFDWKAEDPNAEFGGYWNFLKDDVHIAGGMRNDGSSGQPDKWSVYLATADAH